MSAWSRSAPWSRGLTSTQTARLVRVGDLIPLALGPGAADDGSGVDRDGLYRRGLVTSRPGSRDWEGLSIVVEILWIR